MGPTGRTTFVELALRTKSPRQYWQAPASATERSGGADHKAWNGGVTWTYAKRLTFDVRYYDTKGGSEHALQRRLGLARRPAGVCHAACKRDFAAQNPTRAAAVTSKAPG